MTIHTLDIPGVGDVYITIDGDCAEIVWATYGANDEATDHTCTVALHKILSIDAAKVADIVRRHRGGDL